MKLCPKCEAQKGLAGAAELIDLARADGRNPFAGAEGLLEGVCNALIQYDLELCPLHRPEGAADGRS